MVLYYVLKNTLFLNLVLHKFLCGDKKRWHVLLCEKNPNSISYARYSTSYKTKVLLVLTSSV